jgi:hypothetical protein
MAKGKTKIEIWVSIVTACVSVIALFFSWQANRIAFKQASSQVVVLDTSWNGGGYRALENGQQATCIHLFRLSNLGGVATSLVGYRIRITFENSHLEFESSFPLLVKPDDLTSSIRDFEIYFFPTSTQIDFPTPLTAGLLQFPYKIEPYETFDIQTAVSFQYDLSLKLESARYNEPKSYWYRPETLEGYTPLLLQYTFKTSSGQEFVSPSVACWYIK